MGDPHDQTGPGSQREIAAGNLYGGMRFTTELAHGFDHFRHASPI